MDLADQQCTACRPGSSPVSSQEIVDFLSQYPNWRVRNKDGVQQLECRFIFKEYKQALAFTNRVAEAGQVVDHHPAIFLEWGQVTVIWWTHTIRGIHRNDLIMAARTNLIYQE